jgi:hypothetical protein
MGKKTKIAKPTAKREKPSPEAPTRRKAKARKARPHSMLLADLFLWISVVDECLYHPVGAFDRAAVAEGYGSLGNVVQRLAVLEKRFGQLFRQGKVAGRRSGVPTPRGAALAEIFVLIELLYSWAESLEKSGPKEISYIKVHKLKEFIDYLIPSMAPRRVRDQDVFGGSRISTSLVWSGRLHKTGRPGQPKHMTQWKRFGPSPVKLLHRSSPKSSQSRN